MDKNSTPITDDLLARYLLGEASPDECRHVEHWVTADPLHRKKLDDYRKLLAVSMLQTEQDGDAYEALDRLNRRLDQQGKARKLISPTLKWAAILLIGFGGWLAYTYFITQKLSLESRGYTLTRTLPDGSEATLNQQTSLSFEGGFLRKTREVKLQGEAFFNVKKDAAKPFTIEANHLLITVVGTAFNVKADSTATTVIVESGKVKVATPTDSVFLTRGEKIYISRNNPRLRKENNRSKLYNYYYTNELICDGTPLYELIDVLNKKFNSQIRIENKTLRTLPITVTFKDESLNEILAVVADTFKIKMVRRQGIIALY